MDAPQSSAAASCADFRLGEWLVQPSLGRISGVEGVVHLRPLLMELLLLLVRNPGRLVTKEEINRTLWGRRFLAESALTRLMAELRKNLGDDIESPRFIETIPKRGYRMIAAVSPERGEAPAPSIAVLPFADMAPGEGQEYFCDGLAEDLTNALTHLRGLRVIARTSAFAFKGKGVDVREIGRQLNVSAVLEGGVQRSADRLRVTVQLIDAADGCHLWSDRFDGVAGDVFAIQDEIAKAVVGALKLELLGADESRLLKRHTEDPEAYDLYLRGQYIFAKRTSEACAKALLCFERALERAPGYALASAALASCYCVSGFLGWLAPHTVFPKAKAAAQRALSADPTLAEAHAALGLAAWAYDWDWVEAETRFLRAEELSPSCALAHLNYATALATWARYDEALAKIEHAWALDPLSLVPQATAGWILLEARRYDEAIERCLKTLELDPDFSLANFHLGHAYYVIGRYREALNPLERAAPALPMSLGMLGCTWGKLGRRDKAEAILRQLERRSADRYITPLAFAFVYAGLEDTDAVLDWYEKAFDARDGIVTTFGVDPGLDWLRAEPRFQALLQRLHLPHQ